MDKMDQAGRHSSRTPLRRTRHPHPRHQPHPARRQPRSQRDANIAVRHALHSAFDGLLPHCSPPATTSHNRGYPIGLPPVLSPAPRLAKYQRLATAQITHSHGYHPNEVSSVPLQKPARFTRRSVRRTAPETHFSAIVTPFLLRTRPCLIPTGDCQIYLSIVLLQGRRFRCFHPSASFLHSLGTFPEPAFFTPSERVGMLSPGAVNRGKRLLHAAVNFALQPEVHAELQEHRRSQRWQQ